jgi:hypothetical protein
MKRFGVTLGLLLLAVAGGWWWWRAPDEMRGVPGSAPSVSGGNVAEKANTSAAGSKPSAGHGERVLTPAEKAARIEKIKRDYDDIRAKAAADYGAAGAKFPGGLNAFLRQLALLEREKRADFAAFLSPTELEDLEYRETSAGQLTQRLLADTAATEEQRRAVFRRQLAFEDRFALTFDLAPKALLEREAARQQLQQEIRRELGDALFSAWLRGEGGDFANFSKFVGEQRLPESLAFQLWETKNEFVRRRLELSALGLPAEQARALQGALAKEMEGRVRGVLGSAADRPGARELLAWLPK